MNRTLLPIRLVFIAICAAAGWLICYTITAWDAWRWLGTLTGLLIGVLVVLTDILLRGFSLRGLSAITLGLGMGTLIAHWLGVSPLFASADPQYLFLAQISLFLISTYLCTVIALRGKDEFNLVIPYVRFVPQEVESGIVVLDTSALTDGRVVRICEAGFLPSTLMIPRFVVDEMQAIAESSDPLRQARGRRGLETLAALRRIPGLEIRVPESEVNNRKDLEAKLVFLAKNEKAKILTLDSNLAKLAEFQGVRCLNLHALTRALRTEVLVGERLEIDLVKGGKEEGQAVGFLENGDMVVTENAKTWIGSRVEVEVSKAVPSGAGKLIFARLVRSE
ncbi:MAG: TRAM domain-containing protein [Opitutaceae bacterium]|nr:TRAM domain-containing protein [Opitutaceae bacterium]